jgi:hypothetical protein
MASKTSKSPAKNSAAKPQRAGGTEAAAAKKKFEQGILARGEAVPAGKPLPPGATHEIVGTAPDGSPVLKRKRFSAR